MRICTVSCIAFNNFVFVTSYFLFRLAGAPTFQNKNKLWPMSGTFPPHTLLDVIVEFLRRPMNRFLFHFFLYRNMSFGFREIHMKNHLKLIKYNLAA